MSNVEVTVNKTKIDVTSSGRVLSVAGKTGVVSLGLNDVEGLNDALETSGGLPSLSGNEGKFLTILSGSPAWTTEAVFSSLTSSEVTSNDDINTQSVTFGGEIWAHLDDSYPGTLILGHSGPQDGAILGGAATFSSLTLNNNIIFTDDNSSDIGSSSFSLGNLYLGGATIFKNTSYLSEGTIDKEQGGAKGISMVCSVGIELNWQAQHLTCYQLNNSTPQILFIDSPIIVANTNTENAQIAISHNSTWEQPYAFRLIDLNTDGGSDTFKIHADGTVTAKQLECSIIHATDGVTLDGKVEVGHRLAFSGGSNDFPALFNSGNVLEVILANGGGPADITASHFIGDLMVTNGNGRISSPGNGQLLLSNYNSDDFSLLLFGGVTSGDPAIKKQGNALEIRLADDSDYAGLKADSVRSSYFYSGNETNLGMAFFSNIGVLSLGTNAQICWTPNNADSWAEGDLYLKRGGVGTLELSTFAESPTAIVIASPNGTKYKISVQNDGTIISTPVTP